MSQGHTSPGGEPSTKAETAATLFDDIMNKKAVYGRVKDFICNAMAGGAGSEWESVEGLAYLCESCMVFGIYVNRAIA